MRSDLKDELFGHFPDAPVLLQPHEGVDAHEVERQTFKGNPADKSLVQLAHEALSDLEKKRFKMLEFTSHIENYLNSTAEN